MSNIAWTDGKLIDFDKTEEVGEIDLLLQQFVLLVSVREDYCQQALHDGKRKEEFLEAVAEKEKQMAWIESRLPFKLYLERELLLLLHLMGGNEGNPPDGADFLSDSFREEGGEHEMAGVRFSLLADAYWKVWEPKYIAPEKLRFHPYNAAIYGADEDVTDLVRLIEESRWIKMLTINPSGEVLAGNRRLLALQQLEWSEPVPIEIVRLSLPKEVERLVLDNVSREKTNEQRVREAAVWLNVPGWLEHQRTIEKQKQGNSKKGGVKTREILAAKVGIGSGYSYDKAKQVCDFMDLLQEKGRTQEATELRQLLNEKSIQSAYELFQKLEKKLMVRYIFQGKESIWANVGKYTVHVDPGTELVLAAEVSLADPFKVACRLPDKEQSQVIVDRRDLLQILPEELEANGHAPVQVVPRPSTEYKKKPSLKFKPFEQVVKKSEPARIGKIQMWQETRNGWLIKWSGDRSQEILPEAELDYPPLFAVEDKVTFLFREEVTGVVEGNFWHEQGWRVRVKHDVDGRFECVFESHLHKYQEGNGKKMKPVSFNELRPLDWVSDGNSWAEIKENSCHQITVRFLGIGESPAPLLGEGVLSPKELLYSVQFDPFSPPKFCLRSLKVGDIVCPSWDKEAYGQIESINEHGEFVIELLDGSRQLRLKDSQLMLVSPVDVSLGRGDRVCVAPLNPPQGGLKGGEAGTIVNIYRTCADVLLDGYPAEKPARLLLNWLELEAGGMSFLDCASVEEIKDLFDRLSPAQIQSAIVELWQAYRRLQ